MQQLCFYWLCEAQPFNSESAEFFTIMETKTKHRVVLVMPKHEVELIDQHAKREHRSRSNFIRLSCLEQIKRTEEEMDE